MATIFRPPGISRLPSLTYTRPHEAQNLLNTTLAELIPIGSAKRDWQSRANVVRTNDWKEYPNLLTTTLVKPFFPQQFDVLRDSQLGLDPFYTPNILSTVLQVVAVQSPFIPNIDSLINKLKLSTELFTSANLLNTALSAPVFAPFLPNIYAPIFQTKTTETFTSQNILVSTLSAPISAPFIPNIFYADPLRVQEIQVFDAVNAILALTTPPPPASNKKRVFGFVTG